MKKLCISFTILMAISVSVFSQRSFQQGTSNLNLGIGIGSIYWGSGYSSNFPVNPTASFEYGVTDNISVGAVISYSSIKFSGADIKESGVLFGARGSYHFLTTDKWDPYAGITLGFVSVSVTNNSEQTPQLQSVKDTNHEGGQFVFIKR